jgi:hypothetical protein
MFIIPKTEEIEFILAEHKELPSERIDLGKIYIKHKNIIVKPVWLWRQTMVHDGGFIEARVQSSTDYELIRIYE